MELLSEKPNSRIEDVLASKGRIKIIKVLVLKQETNISNLVQLTGLNHSSVKEHLDFLVNADLIEEKCFGRIKIYRFIGEKMRGKAIKNLIEFWERYD